MKKHIIFIFLLIFGSLAFGEDAEEIDFLLFQPNSGSLFVNHERAMGQLDNLAVFLKDKNPEAGRIFVYGYAAVADNDIDGTSLSRDRALFVINELQKRGLSRNLFSDPVAYGSVNLWGSNIDENAKSPNRRVRVLLDGTVIVPVIVAAEPEPEIVIAAIEPVPEPVFVVAAAPLTPAVEKEKKFPWWLLLPLLLIPLLFLLLRKKDKTEKKKEEKPKKVAQPKPVSAPVPAPTPAPPPPPPAAKAPEPVPPPPPPQEPEPTRGDILVALSMKTGKSVVDLDEEIRRRAYEIFEQRGYEHGHADEHWYNALYDVCTKYEADNYKTKFDQDDYHWKAIRSFIEKKK